MKITWGCCGKIIQDNRIIIKNFTSKCTTQIANRIKTGRWKKCKTIRWQQFGDNKAKLTSGRLSTWFSVFADMHFSKTDLLDLCVCVFREEYEGWEWQAWWNCHRVCRKQIGPDYNRVVHCTPL